MDKHNGNNNRTITKVLYKKSNVTIRTHSRTWSDASQMARSGMMQLKKAISKTNEYYTEGDKVKRDLSVETGFCILRRHYKSKHKRDKCSVPRSPAKSKCSTVADTEIDSVDEFKPDASGCGDSRNKFEVVSQINPTNIDITAMMVENLKRLLNDWIKKHVLEDTDTKQRLVNVLDSILHSLEAKISSPRSSCSTYIVERNGESYKVRNKKTATNSITCQYCRQKQTSLITNTSSSVLFHKYSRFTIPFPYRHMRIISTLSIPRNLYKKDKLKKKEMVCKFKKTSKNNKLSSSNKKEKKVVIDVSSCEIYPASKKSIIKSTKTNGRKDQMKKRGVIFVPKIYYKSTTEYTSTTEVEEANAKAENRKHIHLDTMPSLVKSIYADDPANVTSTDMITTQQNRNDIFTMTEAYQPSVKVGNSISNVRFHEAKYECCKRNVKNSKGTHKSYMSRSNFGYINQTFEFPNMTVPKQNLSKHPRKSRAKSKHAKVYGNRRSLRRKINPWLKYENIKHKHFTYLYKKTNCKHRQENELLNHFRNIFKYFANFEGKRNIKLEIHCNVNPLFDTKNKNSNLDSKSILNFKAPITPENNCDMKTLQVNNAIEYKDKSKDNKLGPEIIPLLDGAVSQAKYIFKSDNSIVKSDNTVKNIQSTDQGTIVSDLDVPKAVNISTSRSELSVKRIESTDQSTVMTGLEVSKELIELKIAIRDLSATAAMIVNEHLRRKCEEKSSNDPSRIMVTPKTVLEHTNETLSKRSTQSKGIQISNTATKGQILSGIKLSKGPKRVEEFTDRLKKRSSSYHVIDSESILRVTDMTSFANKSKLVNPPQLKKSKSLLQFTTEDHKQRLLAFFCDGCKNNNELMCNFAGKVKVSPKPSHQCPNQIASSDNKIYIPVKISRDSYAGCGHEYCSSAYVDIEKPTITVKKRSGLPFWEGCLYCILLWIPLIIIMYFFYDFVLKDLINKPSPTNETRARVFNFEPKAVPLPTVNNNDTKASRFLLKLSDFGF